MVENCSEKFSHGILEYTRADVYAHRPGIQIYMACYQAKDNFLKWRECH